MTAATRPTKVTAVSAAVFAASLIAAVIPTDAQEVQTPAVPETADTEAPQGSSEDRGPGSARQEGRFAELDIDSDGRLTLEEYIGPSRDRMSRMFAHLDRDGSGDLTGAELAPRAEGMARIFVRVDANADGVIDAAEFVDMRASGRQFREGSARDRHHRKGEGHAEDREGRRPDRHDARP